MHYLSTLLLLTFLSGCQYFSSAPKAREAGAFLSQDYSKLRKAHIKDVQYDLKFDLTEADYFTGVSRVSFVLEKPFFLTLDFTAGEVQEVRVNGEIAPKTQYNGFYIEIPESLLRIGQNQVDVVFSQNYSQNGTGLYRYNDPQDGKTYLYSHFEPYWANKMFPCFDQPDLKATFLTEVRTPEGWQVITANRETDIFNDGEVAVWSFPKTQAFSTYAYSLHAGDYHMWESSIKLKAGDTPLRVFARQSMKDYVDSNEWFQLTEKGLQFFEKYFSTPYAYGKYDQIIVPNFNSGAMENVAAVTFNEDRFVPRGVKTRDEARRLAATLLHELAHMWFGNLVTMEWWNDLWLNESFATFASYQALVEVTDYKEGWMVFHNYSKTPAYDLDRSPNTHPVMAQASSTLAASAQFDAITYGKGASVLRQLMLHVGEKNYKKALAQYFAKHSHANTTLKDFMDVMQANSSQDLKSWQSRWLETAMFNELEIHFTCENDKVQTFEIYQTGTQDYPVLRTHEIRVALFYKDRDGFRLWKTLPLEVKGERTEITQFKGHKCPQIAYPNYEDQTYARVKLDKITLSHVRENLISLNNSMTRGLIWSDLWDMTRDGALDMNQYLEIVEYNGLDESHPQNLQRILTDTNLILKRYYPNDEEEALLRRDIWLKFFEQAYLTRLKQKFDDPQIQSIFLTSLLEISESAEVLQNFANLLRGKEKLDLSFPLHQEQRWQVLALLARNNHPEARDLYEKEIKRDLSERGRLQALYVETLWPDLEKKKKRWSDLIESRNEKHLAEQRSIMTGLFPFQQQKLHRSFADDFYSQLKQIYKGPEFLFTMNYINLMVPIFCDADSDTRIHQFMTAEKDALPFPVLKSLRQALFENKRCQEMRNKLLSFEQKNILENKAGPK